MHALMTHQATEERDNWSFASLAMTNLQKVTAIKGKGADAILPPPVTQKCFDLTRRAGYKSDLQGRAGISQQAHLKNFYSTIRKSSITARGSKAERPA